MPAKFTNKFNLPSEVFDSIRYDGHITNGDISVTTLIDPPQIKILKKNNTYDYKWQHFSYNFFHG